MYAGRVVVNEPKTPTRSSVFSCQKVEPADNKQSRMSGTVYLQRTANSDDTAYSSRLRQETEL